MLLDFDADIDSITNPGERLVAQALKEQSPANWTIVYSKYWLLHDMRYNSSRAREGEIDFVVIIPGKGIVCLEVKSAKKYRRTDGGVWQRYDERQREWVTYKQSPWEQACNNKHNLVKILKTRMEVSSFPCAYTAAVVFPRCKKSGPLPAGEDDSMLVIDATGMETLADTVSKSLDAWLRGEGDTGEVARLLCPPTAVFCNSLAVDVENRNKRFVRLTEQQARVLSGLRSNPVVQISGGAGTGKTLLGLEVAKKAVSRGDRVLYLCFSRKLAGWVANSSGLASFVATSFHKLASDYARRAGVDWPERPDADFWKSGVSEVLLAAISQSGSRGEFDTVIVDEAQDFLGEWIIPVLELWNDKDGGQCVFFGDENQEVFGGEMIGHPNMVKYTLQDNCRNTKEIAQVCTRVLRDAGVAVEAGSMSRLPDGEQPRWINGGSLEQRRCETTGCVRNWLDGGLSRNQIAVLSPFANENCLGMVDGNLKVDGIPFTRDLDKWRAGSACLFETVKGFKGMEADAVVVTDIPAIGESKAFGLQDAYIAFSRAKHELVGIAASNAAAAEISVWFAAAGT